MMRRFKASLGLATALYLAGLACTSVMAEDLPGTGKTIRFVQSESTGGNYVLTKIAIEASKRLGYDTKLSTVNTTLFFQAAAQGDMDISVDVTLPQLQPSFDKVKDRTQVVGGGFIQGAGYNGYMIDKKTADAYGITTLEQLKDPKIAGLFGKNGKADLISCDPGWGCGDVVDYQLDKFGLKGTINPVRGKYEALMFENIARLKRGEPVFFYAWAPSWMTNTMVPGKDVVWLPTPFDALPPSVPSSISALTPGVTGCAGGADPCRMAMAAWNWNAIANKKFVADNPAIRVLVEQIGFSRETWSYWEKAISDDGSSDRTIRKLADQWMTENKATLDAWIAKAKAAA
jgi:glycine betaine/proline transport system substrate-binding protein